MKKISFIIPARNEEASIGATLDSVINSATLENVEVEIVVVLDCTTDRSDIIAVGYGCVVVKCSFSSRAMARNLGARIATGDILIFLDADSLVTTSFIKDTLGHFESRCKVLWYKQGPVESGVFWSKLFTIYNSIISYIPLFSPAISCTREEYHSIGGFDAAYKSFEDYFFLRRAQIFTETSCCPSLVKTSVRRMEKYGLIKSMYHFALAVQSPKNYAWSSINE